MTELKGSFVIQKRDSLLGLSGLALAITEQQFLASGEKYLNLAGPLVVRYEPDSQRRMGYQLVAVVGVLGAVGHRRIGVSLGHDQLVFGRLGRFLGAGLLCPGRSGLVYMLIVTGLAFDSVRFLILECDDDVGKHELAAITPSIEILAHHGLFYHNIRQNSLRSILQDLEYVGWARPTTHTGPRLYPALRTIASPIMNCSNSETCLGKSHHEWQFHRSGGLGFGMLRPDLQPARNSQWQTRDVYIT